MLYGKDKLWIDLQNCPSFMIKENWSIEKRESNK
jgi:hypothetical protein